MNSQVKENPEQQPQTTQVQKSVSVPVPVPVTDTTLYIPGDKRKMSTSSTTPQDSKRVRLDNYQSTATTDETGPLTVVIAASQVQAPLPTSSHATHNLHHTHIPSKAVEVKETEEEEEKLLVTPYQHLARSNLVCTPSVEVHADNNLCLNEDLNVVDVSSQEQVNSTTSASPASVLSTTNTTSINSNTHIPVVTISSATPNQFSKSKRVSRVGKLRSRSLPNIVFPSLCEDHNQKTIRLKTHTYQSKKFQQPPVNVQSLSEIDLPEITKNPQLRHDILFDPHLQFRPNLDGDRGKRKKVAYDKYWSSIVLEIEMFLNGDAEIYDNSKIPTLFICLRDILLSLLPSKDRQGVIDVMDIELLMQQMVNKSLDFVSLSLWLSDLFKAHCAPMRDAWADEMVIKFKESEAERSVQKLVEGLRMVFTILEAMKLDVANHQIKSMRPGLIETAVEFERGYFQEIVSRGKLDISNSIRWYRSHEKSTDLDKPHSIMIDATLSLLSCSKMVSEFPSALIFDHSRLIMLRASVRQLVCLQLCVTLYHQLVCKHVSNPKDRLALTSVEKLKILKREVMAIITDDNGNIKWTKNISAIALHIATKATGKADEKTVEFGFSWLIKQTQPSSPVYSLMETRVFNEVKSIIMEMSTDISLEKLSKLANKLPNIASNKDDTENVAHKVALLTRFHFAVFNQFYQSS